jgi:hypothetical protein
MEGAGLGVDDGLMVGRCENGLSVETTAWEGWKEKQGAGKSAT